MDSKWSLGDDAKYNNSNAGVGVGESVDNGVQQGGNLEIVYQRWDGIYERGWSLQNQKILESNPKIMHEAEIQCELKMTPMTPEHNKKALQALLSSFFFFSFSPTPPPLWLTI